MARRSSRWLQYRPERINAFAVHGNTLWMARPDVLEKYRLQGDRAVLEQVIGSHDGFPAIEINRIWADADGRVWMTSRVGLWRYDPRDRTFRRYGVEDGLPSPEFTDALVRLDGGTVYAGTLAGVVGFRPALLHDHARKPMVVLEGVSVLRKGKRTPLNIDHGKLQLAWDDSNLRVVVKALSYINPARNHYRFRMRGFDAGWVATGTQGAREFTGLRAGSYRLDVEAAGTSGAWSPLKQTLDFEVAAPPWNTPLGLAFVCARCPGPGDGDLAHAQAALAAAPGIASAQRAAKAGRRSQRGQDPFSGHHGP